MKAQIRCQNPFISSIKEVTDEKRFKTQEKILGFFERYHAKERGIPRRIDYESILNFL